MSLGRFDKKKLCKLLSPCVDSGPGQVSSAVGHERSDIFKAQLVTVEFNIDQ